MRHTLISLARQALRAAPKCLTPGLAAGVLIAAQASALAKPAQAANPRVSMVVEKRGTILIELLPGDAPKTVAHFLELVKKKFYDGILFHRYVPGFVVQGGDPKSKKVDGAKIADIPAEQVATQFGLGDGGSGTTVPLEARASHDRGTVGLARSSDPNSGDSQFFFNLQPNLRLDGGYCVFGRVVDKKSLAVMDKIRQGDKITSIRVVEEKPKSK
jgi:cyclophilin family peptidyl-prolyl cis-trans isomerase